MHLFFSVGEPSGDQHAAHLIRELRRRRPDVRCVGFGGNEMQAAGCELHFRLTDMAVMGVFAVLPLIWKFFKLARQAKRYFEQHRPDAVVLVDFPGFNWWIAKYAKRAGVRVVYYLPPQIWAWADWRIVKIRRYCDDVICGLPFEPAWYAARGVRVDYVGHPFFDEVAERALDGAFVESWTSNKYRNVAILPGSRNQEVHRNFPIMIEMMQRIHERHPNVRFLVACYKESHRRLCSSQLIAKAARLPVHLFVGKTSEVIQVAECCSMVSGSVSLEVLARGKPAIVQYAGDWLMYAIGKLLVKCQFMSLPNLFVDREVMPEFAIAYDAPRHIPRMVEVLHGWLSVADRLTTATQEMAQIRDELAQTGATTRAAEVLLKRLCGDEAIANSRAA